ncbi:MAG: hypothetical protein GXO10_06360 [Crenarchaeota archaeon]|nr:hypothetical protein [Thermoproteota archaeon]
MDTLQLHVVDAEKREITRLEVYKDSIRKLIHPGMILYKICKENNMRDIVAVLQHPSKIFGLPSSSLYVVKYDENIIYMTRVLVSKSLPEDVLGIVFRGCKVCDIYVDKEGVKFENESDSVKIVSVEGNSVRSEIFSILSNVDLDRFSIYVRKGSATVLHVSDNVFLRKMHLLHKYSPIVGPDAPIGRSGIVALINKLKGLELREDVDELLRQFSARRGCCICCLSCCLNYVDDAPLMYDTLCKVYDYCIDDDMLSKLRSVCDDPIFILQSLYMYRFSYPERLSKGFEKRASTLYFASSLLDLCPLSLLLFAKSRNFELDIPIQVLWYVYRRAIDPDRLTKIVEALKPGFRTRIDADTIENVMKTTLSVDDVPEDVSYVSPSSKLKGRKIQLALDLVSNVEELIDIAFTCVSAGVEVIEIGTPLLKYYGAKIIEQMKANLPEGVILFADTKTMDVGDLEARLAYRAGADMMSVMAIGTLTKVREAVFEAMKFDKLVLVDLMQVPDPVQSVSDMRELLDDVYPWLVICLHRGITEQLRGRGIESDVDLLRKVRDLVGERCPIAVAGGIRPGTARKLAEAGANIIIVGAALYTSRNIKETAERLVKEIKEQ